jgi:hypothetical protein
VQPENETTPSVSVWEHPETAAPLVPVPVVIARFTVELSGVATFPKASKSVTTGCVRKAVPAVVELLGEVVKDNWVATPPVMDSTCVALARAPDAVRVGVPAAVSP